MTNVLKDVALFIAFIIFVSAALAKEQPKVWKDPYLHMEFVWIPGGCFQMGRIKPPERKPSRGMRIMGRRPGLHPMALQKDGLQVCLWRSDIGQHGQLLVWDRRDSSKGQMEIHIADKKLLS